jgi:hypothetical protein
VSPARHKETLQRESRIRNLQYPTPAISWMCGKQWTLSTCVFGCVASKELTSVISGCVANTRVSGEWLVASSELRKRLRGVGVPPSCWRKERRNDMKEKEIEIIFRCNATGLQRERRKEGAMKTKGIQVNVVAVGVTSLQTVWRVGEVKEEDCDELIAKITTQVTRWIRLPLLDDGTELVHVQSLLFIWIK